MDKKDWQRCAPVYVEEELESTNSKLKTMAAESGTVLVARRQSGGRGRQGRSFASPEGGIYLSYLLRPDCRAEECSALSALTALAVHDALFDVSGVRTDIKWPNDLLLNGKKLCGILTELSFDRQGRPEVVIGIGLNLNTPPEAFPAQIREIACSLCGETGKILDAELVLRRLIQRMDEAYGQWAQDRRYFLERYRERSICRGKDVLVIQGEESKTARVLEINEDLSLQILYGDGRQEALHSGEISIRAIKDVEL